MMNVVCSIVPTGITDSQTEYYNYVIHQNGTGDFIPTFLYNSG